MTTAVGTREVVWYPAGVDPLDPGDQGIMLQGDPTSPFRELMGSSNAFLTPWVILEDATPGVDGSTFRSVRRAPRDPSFRFECRTDDPAVFADAMQELAFALTASRQPGTLVVRNRYGTDGGSERMIRCLYASGLEGDPLLTRTSRVKWWPFTLKFRAFDPCWYDLEPTVAVWTGKAGTAFFPRVFPYTLAPYGLTATTPLDLGGDTDSWPKFTLSGPWTRAKFTRDSTFEAWEVVRGQDYLTETLVVDTQPGPGIGVRTLDGQNRYSWLDFTSSLFPLSPGDTVSVEADGTTSDTQFTLSVVGAWQGSI